jgi:hypothetical protein
VESPGNTQRLARRWRVSEPNGDLGNMRVSISDADLPAGITGELGMFVNASSDFTTGSSFVPMTLAGGIWTVSLNLNHTDYFTFGCIMPTPTVTPTLTVTPTQTLTETPTTSPTPTYTPTSTATVYLSPTVTPTVSPTLTVSATWTITLTPEPTETCTQTLTPDLPAGDLTQVKAYPNPCRGEEHQFEIRFMNLPAKVTLRLYSLDGQLVRTLLKDDASNRASWQLDNQQGTKVASGIYIYVIQDEAHTVKGKVAVLH